MTRSRYSILAFALLTSITVFGCGLGALSAVEKKLSNLEQLLALCEQAGVDAEILADVRFKAVNGDAVGAINELEGALAAISASHGLRALSDPSLHWTGGTNAPSHGVLSPDSGVQ